MERFWAKVNKAGPVQPHVPRLGPCWTWTAFRNPNGYGMFMLNRRRGTVLSHRFAWELERGSTGGLHVLHKCDNRACVRPDHLFLGTEADNSADKVAKRRQSRGPAHGMKNRGEGQGGSKLTAADVLEIRAMLAAGIYQKVIAEKFGVEQTNISAIHTGKTWFHL